MKTLVLLIVATITTNRGITIKLPAVTTCYQAYLKSQAPTSVRYTMDCTLRQSKIRCRVLEQLFLASTVFIITLLKMFNMKAGCRFASWNIG